MSSSVRVPHLSERDHAVIELVAKFRQLTAVNIRDSLFADLASATPVDRTLKRLLEQEYLIRLCRLVGGDGGGSGQYVYQLGRRGWTFLNRPGNYWAPRAVNLHTLAIADCFVTLKRAEHRGELTIITFETEPDCHVGVADVELTPDGYLEIGDRQSGLMFRHWLEVDRGTEHAEKIKDKCARYWRGFQSWPEEYYPRVLFVVPDQRRMTEINRIIRSGPDAARALFHTCTHTQLESAVVTDAN